MQHSLLTYIFFQLFVWCLGIQFDCNITDRPLILQTILQIHNHLTTKRFLTWDFFLNRFDTLFLEDQIILERLGEISYVRGKKEKKTFQYEKKHLLLKK